MKTNAIIRIIVFSLTICILCGILAAGLTYGSSASLIQTLKNWGSAEDASAAAQKQTPVPEDETTLFNPKTYRNLEIQWAAGTIRLQPGDVDAIQLTESMNADTERMVIAQGGDTISVSFKENNTFVGISEVCEKDLTITVPRDWVCGELEIDAGAAEVRISDLTIGEMDFDGASGKCILENCNISALDLDTASGDIQFSGTLDTLDCDAASASFTADLLNVPSRMDLDSVSGDLELTLPQDAGFIVNLDALSGDFTTDFASLSQNGQYVCGDGRCRIDVSCMSGNVRIHQCHNENHTQCHTQHHEETTAPCDWTNTGSCDQGHDHNKKHH